MPLKFTPGIEAPDSLFLYAEPEKDTKYAIGVDGAVGIGQDYTAIQVWSRRIPFEQVAWFRSKHINTVDGSKVMINLANYYNKGLLVIETRFPGNAYQDNAINVYAYRHLYRKEQRLDESPDISTKFGICTTDADKNLLVNETKALLEHKENGKLTLDKLIFHDQTTLEAFCNFVWIEGKNKCGGSPGTNDDDVMATMLAIRGCLIHPQAARPTKRKFALTEQQAHQQHLMQKHFERIAKGKKVTAV